MIAFRFLAWLPLVLPTAAGCSFAGEEPPPPGVLMIWDLAADTIVNATVEERLLGAACELSNPHDVEDRYLVWVEPLDFGDVTRIHDAQTGETSATSLAGTHQAALGVEGDYILHRSGDTWYLFVISAAFDAPVAVSAENPSWHAPDGTRIVYTQTTGSTTKHSVYSAVDQDWIVKAKTHADLGIPGNLTLTHVGQPWLLFEDPNGGRARWAYNWNERAALDVSGWFGRDQNPSDLDAGWAYVALDPSSDPRVGRVRLTDGVLEDLGRPAVTFGDFSVGENRVVFPFYSQPTPAPARTRATPSDPAPQQSSTADASGLGLAVILVACAVVTWRIRPR